MEEADSQPRCWSYTANTQGELARTMAREGYSRDGLEQGTGSVTARRTSRL